MKRRWAWLVVGVAALLAVAVVLALTFAGRDHDGAPPGVTVGERMDALKAERAALQARAGAGARVELVQAFRIASLLSDALAVRAEAATERTVDRLPPAWREGLAALDVLNMALDDASARPGAGATLAANGAAKKAEAALDKQAGGNELPLVLSFTPRFILPRRATGELTLAPPAASPPPDGSVRLGTPSAKPGAAAQPTVPVYAPSFATSPDGDPPVAVEIAGLRLGRKGSVATLSVGAWRGEAVAGPERLRFAVPRSAFATAPERTILVAATLAIREGGRTLTFELPFVVLPDRPGSAALDQRVRSTTRDSKTLVSPEILSRAGVGKTNTVHRCFDPPPGWQFDKAQSHVVVVERLAWVDDVSDETMNAGTVELSQGKPQQLCVDVVARPAAKTARTATIGRFEATLVRDREEDKVVHTGVRALDWREPLRLPLAPGTVEWKLYVRLFGEIDRDFDGKAADLPFLHIAVEDDKDGAKMLVLTADPRAEPN